MSSMALNNCSRNKAPKHKILDLKSPIHYQSPIPQVFAYGGPAGQAAFAARSKDLGQSARCAHWPVRACARWGLNGGLE